MRALLAGLMTGLIAALLQPGAALADEVKVLTTGAFKPIIAALAPRFEAETGHRLLLENQTAGELMRRIRDGASFDLVVLTAGGLDELAGEGRVSPESRTPLARVGIGVAVKAGAPRPDIGSVDAFKRMLLQARSVAVIDPRSGGSSGLYLADLFGRLGVADDVRSKAVLVPGGLVAERVARGEAEIALHQISEILPVGGVDLVGPLPEPVQNYTTYAAALGPVSARNGPAVALLALLSGPAAGAVLAEKGMLPPTR